MLTIKLERPYKILLHKLKRYSEHYQIPAERCVIIPMKCLGDDALCNVRWEDPHGVLHLKEGLFFAIQNLESINAMTHFSLFELWQHYTSRPLVAEHSAMEGTESQTIDN